MKKIAIWPIAIATSMASLGAMLLFDYLLSAIYAFIGKLGFLKTIFEIIDGMLDLALTGLVAALLATYIWEKGHRLIEKIKGESIEFDKGPVYKVNCVFIAVFLVALVFFCVEFFGLVGGMVTSYTYEAEGLTRIMLFFTAIKDTALFIFNEHILFYRLGSNSLFLAVINVFNSGI